MDLTLFTAFILVVDGFLLGVGWIVAGAVYAAILGVLGRGRAP